MNKTQLGLHDKLKHANSFASLYINQTCRDSFLLLKAYLASLLLNEDKLSVVLLYTNPESRQYVQKYLHDLWCLSDQQIKGHFNYGTEAYQANHKNSNYIFMMYLDRYVKESQRSSEREHVLIVLDEYEVKTNNSIFHNLIQSNFKKCVILW